jgi:mono/diheme cytochrome c family protein
MRATVILLLLVALGLLAQEPTKPEPKPVSTMSQLMVDLIYPTSNDLFYIYREPPKTEIEWNKIKLSALTLAESANLLMDKRAWDKDKWMVDAQLLLDVGNKAYKAAVAKDWEAIYALNEELNTSCVTCHTDYRPIFQRRAKGAKQAPKQ